MSKYDLLVNATVTAISTPPKPQFQAVRPPGPNNPDLPPQEQTFHVVTNGVGAVSGSVQIVVSNDSGADPSLYNWIAYGDPITAAGTNNGQASASMNGSWRNFGAYVSAISGTNAAVTCHMAA